MKVAYYDRYGTAEVVSIRELPKPTPKKNELLVKVIASAVTAADSRIRAARFPKGFGLLAKAVFGLSRPRRQVLGSIFSGVVEAVGSGVDEFNVGDEVCGTTGLAMGTHAEYVIVKATGSVTKKPAKLTHQDVAAMLFGGTAALSFVSKQLKITSGEVVLVNGASGAVGTNAVQLAKHFGAEVVGVTSGDNAALVRKLGAKKIIDYTQKSVFDNTERYDVVLDTVGNISLNNGKKLLRPNGRLGLMVASLGEILKASFMRNVVVGTATEKREEIEFLLSLMEKGELQAVVDKTYSLQHIIEAHKHVDSGKKKGNVVITP